MFVLLRRRYFRKTGNFRSLILRIFKLSHRFRFLQIMKSDYCHFHSTRLAAEHSSPTKSAGHLHIVEGA